MTVTFRDFYYRHYRLLLSVAEQRLGSRADAEDATAEVFRIAWTRCQDGESGGRDGVLSLPWAYQTLRNVIGNEYRRRDRASRLVQEAGPILAEEGTSARDGARLPGTGHHTHGPGQEDAAVVRHCLRELAEADREALYMAYWEDLSRQEIADVLGCSAVAVRVRLHRARKKMAELLETAGAADITLEVRDG